MPTISGVVEYVGTKNGNGSIKLDDGNWYGFYKTTPQCSKGDTVAFDYTIKGNYRNGNAETVTVADTGTTSAASSASAPSNQDVIRYQAARNTAVELMKVLSENGALELPTKKAEKYDAIMSFFYMTTDRFFKEAASCGADVGVEKVEQWEGE